MGSGQVSRDAQVRLPKAHLWSCGLVASVQQREVPGLEIYSEIISAKHVNMSVFKLFRLCVVCALVCVWSQGDLQKSVRSFCHVDSGTQTQVVRLGSKCPFSLSQPLSFETTAHYVAQGGFELTVPLAVLELLVILLLWLPEGWG